MLSPILVPPDYPSFKSERAQKIFGKKAIVKRSIYPTVKIRKKGGNFLMGNLRRRKGDIPPYQQRLLSLVYLYLD